MLVKDSVPLLNEGEEEEGRTQSLTCDSPVPISRPPSQPRDGWYAIAFLGHFAATILLSFAEGGKRETESAFLMSSYDAGSWASILMIVCLLSSVGGMPLAGLGLADLRMREEILSTGVLMAHIIVQISVGNTFLLLKGHYAFAGIYFLASAVMSLARYGQHASSLAFLSSLLDIVVDLFQEYKVALFVACALIIVAQTLVLLWWGAFFVGLLSTTQFAWVGGSGSDSEETSPLPLVLLMLGSWYWITQFFQALTSFLLGGCVLWYYEIRRVEAAEEENVNPRVWLYAQCAATSSLGTICKGGLYSGLSSRLLNLTNHVGQLREHASPRLRLVYDLLASMIGPMADFARRNHKLALCLSATYGNTFSKSGNDQYKKHPESIDLLLVEAEEELHALSALGSTLSGIFALLFAICTRNEGSSRGLFLLLCYLMAHSGVTLALHCYSATIYAYVVAFSNAETRVPLSSVPAQRWSRKLDEWHSGAS